DVLIEFCYPECTASVITASSIQRAPSKLPLGGNRVHATPLHPSFLINLSQLRYSEGAIEYFCAARKLDGGWVGSWGTCFTYAAQFVLESLSLVGENYSNSSSV
ncbi:hypothetical protein EDC04DRAFT_2576984, partial [Pisolithus marmoratus]